MKASTFKQLIKECVKEAVREELTELFTAPQAQPKSLKENFNFTSDNVGNGDLRQAIFNKVGGGNHVADLGLKKAVVPGIDKATNPFAAFIEDAAANIQPGELSQMMTQG